MKAFGFNHVNGWLLVALAFCSLIMATASTSEMNLMGKKHPIEDEESWRIHVERKKRKKQRRKSNDIVAYQQDEEHTRHRFLKKNKSKEEEEEEHKVAFLGHSAYKGGDIHAYEEQQEEEYEHQQQKEQIQKKKEQAQEKKEFNHRMSELNHADSGIDVDTVHGMMIDAGSQGSRMHIYEWEPRILRNEQDVRDAVSGNKLSFPGTDTRWTERLRPGIATFASIQDDAELERAVAEYLAPLLDFAKTVLHTKKAKFHEYPIFLRATAGMRILDTQNRARVITAVRNLFNNTKYCPFRFVPEQVRVLSGEEEAIYDWAGVNFLMGDLIEQSEGAGTVINPRKTHGALDLGGASTQISFYESKEDIMSDLFKLQIGQAKHWNVYAHSFLYYGIEEAQNRFQARLAADKSAEERLVAGVFNPCLPGKTRVNFRSDIHLVDTGAASTGAARIETWNYTEGAYPSGDGMYQAILKNDNDRGDPDACLDLAKDLLHLEQNEWCNFDHKGECSFAGVYQPELPVQSDTFHEFLAFSNYYDVWKFLNLPERATIAQLENATRHACSLSWDELVDFAPKKLKDDEALESYCFRSAYVYQLLHNGFGFQDDNVIRAVRVISGMRVDWALGAMLYEINALPWSHDEQQQPPQPQQQPQHQEHHKDVPNYIFDNNDDEVDDDFPLAFLVASLIAICIFLLTLFAQRERRRKQYDQYEPVKEVILAV